MRGKNPLWISLIALLLTSAIMTGTVTSSASASMYVDPPHSFVSPDDPNPTFTVVIRVDVGVGVDEPTLYGWDFTLSFDSSFLQVLDIVMGLFLYEDTGWETAWQWGFVTPVIDNVNGFASAGDVIMADEWTGELPGTGASGTGEALASIEFQVIGYGVCNLGLESTELATVVGDPPYQTFTPIVHTVGNGFFDNRLANAPPIAGFSAVATTVVGMPVTFTSTSIDPDGWLISEEWDFGDGETGSGSVVEHTYAEEGIYTATLTVTDNDLETSMATTDILVQKWTEGGWMPDFVDWCAKPEHPDLDEAFGDRHLDILARIANPTEDDYEVYAEFELYSKDEAQLLGTLCTNIYNITSGEIVNLSADFDTANPQWRAFSGSPEWVSYGYTHWRMHKYIGFASCYSRPVGTEEWTQGYVSKYLSFHVKEVRHDIAVLEVTTNATEGKVPEGNLLGIYVNMTNEGPLEEPFDITVTYTGRTTPETELEVRPTTLEGNETRIETFTLDTSGMTTERYVIKAILSTLTYETDTMDNKGICVVDIE